MKKILLFMLLFVNLQIVIKEYGFIFNAGADVMAQVMSAEPYTCYDRETGDVYPSNLPCKYDKPKYGTNVSSGGGSCGGSVEMVSSEEDDIDVPPVNVSGVKEVVVDGQKIEGKIISVGFQFEIPHVEAIGTRVKLPPIPNVPRYVPVHRLAAIMAALGYPDFSKFKNELERNGWHIADDEAKRLGLNLHDLTGLDAMLLKSDDGQSYVLVFAGTNIHSLADLVTDADQYFNGKAPQYDSALSLALKLNNLLADKNLTFVGHSLGGGLATLASLMTGRYAITFNPAALNNLMVSRVFMNRVLTGNKFDTSKIFNYVMQGENLQQVDPLQAINATPNTIAGFCIGERVNVTNYTGGDGHGIATMVDNLDPNRVVYEIISHRK